MPSITRRRVLQAAAGSVAGLAGCSAETHSTRSPTPSAPGPPADALRNPPTVSLRNPAREPVVTGEAVGITPDATEESGADEEDLRWARALVATEVAADSIAFADVEGADAGRQFLADTDFDAETVYVEQRELGECFERDLCWVRWSEDELETAYGHRYRPADVACDADATDVVARFIRLPVALDPESVRGFGSQTSSGGCREGDATGEGGGGADGSGEGNA